MSTGQVEERTFSNYIKDSTNVNISNAGDNLTDKTCITSIAKYIAALISVFGKLDSKADVYFGYDADLGPIAKLFRRIFDYCKSNIATNSQFDIQQLDAKLKHLNGGKRFLFYI